MNKPLYLDYAAATPLDPEVLTVMTPYFTEKFYNPSSLSLSSRQVKSDIEEARHNVAKLIGATTGEVIFTAGGTEANNLAIKGIMSQYPDKTIITSPIEHDSVQETAKIFNHSSFLVNNKGRVILNELSNLLNDGVVLVSCIYASNEIGTVQPLSQIAEIIRNTRLDRLRRNVQTPLYFHTDACQAAAYLDINVARLGIDLMTLNGGKIYGPKQSGCLYIRTGTVINPLIIGGGQEKDLRSGTENVPGIIGFSSALNKSRDISKKESERLTELRDYLIELLQENYKDIIIHGDLKKRNPNNLSLALPGLDNERLQMTLENHGVIIAIGSACHAASGEPSKVLRAIGVSDELASSTVRVSFGRETTKKDIEKFLEILNLVYEEVKRLS